MDDTRIVYGVTLVTLSNPFPFSELRHQVEAMAHLALWDRYALTPRAQKWTHEEASMWEDPDTGEEFEMPERWLLLVEGWSE